MNRLALALAGAVLVSGCSDSRDRRIPVDDNLTRPLEVARVDSTQPLAPIEHQATSTPEPAAMPKPRKAKRAAPKATPPPPPASVPAEDTTTRGYAPEQSPVADTAQTPLRDSAAVPTPKPTPAPDTIAARTPDTTSSTDTARSVARDTSSPSPSPVATSTAVGARTLPIGTEIHAALDDSINSRTDSAGRGVTAVVMENVTGSDGKTLIPAGAPVQFTVTRLSAAKSKTAEGRLVLQVETIGIGGQQQRVAADVQPVPHELRGRGVGTSEAAKVGVGAAGGAVLGRVLGGNSKGAVIGGVVGAAGGAVVASQTASRDVVVKAKTPVTFVLTEPLVAP
ncbi:MAG TPA: glycine zipper 2TM domain-containing protein [Gemmatimonadales bacterium]|nr:glycine zipper 2TM domain-containing protein [Gemmatimonadales bacterium]